MTLSDIGHILLWITPFFIATIWALMDVSIKKFPSPKEKAMWWLIAIVPFAGWLIYLVIGFWRGEKTDEPFF